MAAPHCTGFRGAIADADNLCNVLQGFGRDGNRAVIDGGDAISSFGDQSGSHFAHDALGQQTVRVAKLAGGIVEL